jgi:cell filamentation protein
MLADHAGYPLDLEKLDPTAMLSAMIDSVGGNEENLARVIRGLIA